jgi:hypothetical protein
MQSLKRIGPIAIDLEFSRFFRGPHVKNGLGVLRANKTFSPKPVKELLHQFTPNHVHCCSR